MADIAMQPLIEADPDAVYTVISTADGIHGWFTTTATATATATEPEPGKRLVLAGENGPWSGTTQTYEILTRPESDVTLRFTHSGFPAVDDAHRDFTHGWATKFTRLKAYTETGKPVPFFTG